MALKRCTTRIHFVSASGPHAQHDDLEEDQRRLRDSVQKNLAILGRTPWMIGGDWNAQATEFALQAADRLRCLASRPIDHHDTLCGTSIQHRPADPERMHTRPAGQPLEHENQDPIERTRLATSTPSAHDVPAP